MDALSIVSGIAFGIGSEQWNVHLTLLMLLVAGRQRVWGMDMVMAIHWVCFTVG
jgi:hypothetical protein